MSHATDDFSPAHAADHDHAPSNVFVRPEHPHPGYLPPIQSDGLLRRENLYRLIAEADIDTAVPNSVAVGKKLFSDGLFGADLLYVPPNKSFPIHTHPGQHLLLCLRGTGTATYGGIVHEVEPGDLYWIPADAPHAVGAGPQGHWLVAIGMPHKALDSEERMNILDPVLDADKVMKDANLTLELARRALEQHYSLTPEAAPEAAPAE